MKVWKVVLGIFITVAVLSPAYGVAYSQYRAVGALKQELTSLEASREVLAAELETTRKELVSSVAEAKAREEVLVGKTVELEVAGRELASGLAEAKAREEALTSRVTEAEVKGKSLTDSIALLAARQKDLEGRYDTLEVEYKATKVQLASKIVEYKALVSEVGQLEEVKVKVGVLRSEEGSLSLQVSSLQSEKASLSSQVSSLSSQVGPLSLQVSSLNSQVNSLTSQAGALSSQASTLQSQVSALSSQVTSLNSQISALQAARTPLIVESYRGSFACTGSMEPKITCLDEATWLSNFRPQDIIVGTVISFTPVAACNLTSTRVAHRVMSVKVEAGTIYYWPKGDANSSDDGCWIPQTKVDSYIIALYKNTKLENAPIRDRINALKAAMDSARAVSDTAYQTYKEKRIQYCGSWTGECYLPTDQYDELTSLWGLYEAKYSQYKTAYDSYWAAMEIEKLRL